MEECAAQLAANFAGIQFQFDPPHDMASTCFHARIKSAMRAARFGETPTYGAIANAVGEYLRAVGHACGRNPFPIVVHCHRIVATKGRNGE